MQHEGDWLRQARDAAKMSPSLLAQLAKIDEAALRATESGKHALQAPELDRCARVFGVRLNDLLQGCAPTSPLALLFRTSFDDMREEQRAVAVDLHSGLGEFLRVIRDIADLERSLGFELATLPHLVPSAQLPKEHEGEQLSRTLREHLKLGNDPIESMREVVEETFRIRVVWVTEEQLDRSIDGASTVDPRPAILVNLLNPELHPWRTRITLAHELGHILFDYNATRRALVSPHTTSWQQLDNLERRARAFAATLLAPTQGVLEAVGATDPSSELAVRKVGERFGVGRTVAINRLQHVCGLSPVQRALMEARSGTYAADFSKDAVDEVFGYRGSTLQGLVRQGLHEGKISKSRARGLLGLSQLDPLPFDDLPAMQEPIIGLADRSRRLATQVLAKQWPGRGLLATTAEQTADGWRVTVVEGGIGHPRPRQCGYLVLSATGELIRSHLDGAGGG